MNARRPATDHLQVFAVEGFAGHVSVRVGGGRCDAPGHPSGPASAEDGWAILYELRRADAFGGDGVRSFAGAACAWRYLHELLRERTAS